MAGEHPLEEVEGIPGREVEGIVEGRWTRYKGRITREVVRAASEAPSRSRGNVATLVEGAPGVADYLVGICWSAIAPA